MNRMMKLTSGNTCSTQYESEIPMNATTMSKNTNALAMTSFRFSHPLEAQNACIFPVLCCCYSKSEQLIYLYFYIFINCDHKFDRVRIFKVSSAQLHSKQRNGYFVPFICLVDSKYRVAESKIDFHILTE